MAGRNLRDNAAAHEFVGDFASGPLADGAARLGRRGAGQFDDLAHLGVGNPHRPAGPRRIGQPLRDGQVRERYRLQSQPALAPQPRHVETDPELAGNLAVVGTAGGGQDDARAEGKLLGRRVAADQLVEALALRRRQEN